MVTLSLPPRSQPEARDGEGGKTIAIIIFLKNSSI